jgi:formate hydrogenlyase transcriptional activator
MAYALEGFAVANALESEVAIGRMNSETERKQFKEKEIRPWRTFGAIVGRSRLLEGVLQLASVVAPTDSSVLIQGETGTGKELVARAIHYWSARRDCAFIKLNCAAIPFGLLESELFGHEKGAFTGAIAQKVGRFELANKGTLFLDEVGDIPLELQAKLLRVLQEQEFERLGSNRTHKVDVRLIAATHRDLCAMIRQSTFREDLYYRMRVFPIHVPPLRQRAEDIPELARHFTAACAQRMNKRIDHIPAETLDAMARYPWPGNIRELQNFIERSLIMASGNVFRPRLEGLTPPQAAPFVRTLADAERAHILETLRQTNGVVGGANGAAARLGVPRTTLIAKMQKLGLSRELPPRAETHEDHAPSFWGKTPALPLGRFAAAARASF